MSYSFELGGSQLQLPEMTLSTELVIRNSRFQRMSQKVIGQSSARNTNASRQVIFVMGESGSGKRADIGHLIQYLIDSGIDPATIRTFSTGAALQVSRKERDLPLTLAYTPEDFTHAKLIVKSYLDLAEGEIIIFESAGVYHHPYIDPEGKVSRDIFTSPILEYLQAYMQDKETQNRHFVRFKVTRRDIWKAAYNFRKSVRELAEKDTVTQDEIDTAIKKHNLIITGEITPENIRRLAGSSGTDITMSTFKEVMDNLIILAANKKALNDYSVDSGSIKNWRKRKSGQRRLYALLGQQWGFAQNNVHISEGVFLLGSELLYNEELVTAHEIKYEEAIQYREDLKSRIRPL